MRFTVRASFSALLVVLSLQGAHAQDKVSLQLSWIPTGQFAAYFVGVAKGFYRDERIELSIMKGSGSADAVRRVAAGAATFGDGDISAVMTGRIREKLPSKCIQSVYTQSPHSIFVLEGSGIEGLKDLAGKTVGTTTGNSHQAYFPIVARMAGLDPSSIKFVTVDPSAMGPLLLTGKIDAAPQFSLNFFYQDQQARQMGKKIRVIPYADYGFKIYSICLHTSENVIATQPDLIRRFLKATKTSVEWMRDNPEAAAALHHSFNPESDAAGSLGEIKAVISLEFNQDSRQFGYGRFNLDRLAQTWKVVAESQGMDSSVPATVFVDERFVPDSPKAP